jgi:hypothetical protein
VEVKIGHEREFLLLSDIHGGSSTRSTAGELASMQASLSLPHLRAETQVWLVWGVETALSDLFDDLAANWRGWKGVKKWEAYEGGLALGCSSDRLGHITITVELRQLSHNGWLVRGDVPLDAGQLELVAQQMRQFFSYR